MTGYLQRLFDRGGADAPMPAAPSMSPVAQADQRLTVPGIGDALMWQPTGFGAEAEPGADAFAADRGAERAVPRALDTPVSRPPIPSGRSVAPQPLPPVASVEPARPPVAPDLPQPRASPTIPSQIRHIGAIEPGDLELPADSDPPVRPADSRRQVPDETDPAPAARPVVDRARPIVEPVPAPPAPAAPEREAPAPTERRAADPKPEDPASRAAPAPEAEAARLAEPAPPAPALAVPVPEPKPPPLEAPAPPRAAPDPPAPRPEPRRSETFRAPEAPRPPRPLTANEVSVIGPLPPSRRSATLFGLRRR